MRAPARSPKTPGTGLDGAERVLHGLPPDAHDIRCLIQAPLHGVDDGLMLPALDATLLAGRASRLDRAGRTGAGPVVPQGQAVLDIVEPPDQPLNGSNSRWRRAL
jgi:hypothetical protein